MFLLGVAWGIDLKAEGEHMSSMAGAATAAEDVLNAASEKVESLLSKPNTDTKSSLGDSFYFIVKRVVDVIIGTLFLLIAFPILLIVAVAIYIENPGPILYKQRRYGHLGVPFNVYKFRSMVVNADALKEQLAGQNEATGLTFKMRNDPRITKIGKIIRKLSIDETPQMLNVISGEISIVGPRPIRVGELNMEDPEHAARQCVKPGLMCYREIMGRSNLSFEQWLELDLKYIRERSLRVDFLIMLKAVPSVLLGKGSF